MNLFPAGSLSDLSKLDAYNSEGLLQVVIETPRGSRNKYTFDPQRRVIVLKKILPAGMSFPYDFGFVPSTRAGDGDPIDVLVLMDEPAFPGCVLDVRVLGVITGEDGLPDGGTQRNDRVLAVAALSQTFADLRGVGDLPAQTLEHLQQFFVTYPRLLGGKTYRLLGTEGPEEAQKLIEAARKNA